MFRRFDTHEHLNERIDQEARNAQKQKWDSAVAVWKTQSALAREAAQADLNGSVPGAGGATADPLLMDVMAERLNYLEKKTVRIEKELRAWERKDNTRGRTVIWSVGLATLLVSMGLIIGLLLSADHDTGISDFLRHHEQHQPRIVANTHK